MIYLAKVSEKGWLDYEFEYIYEYRYYSDTKYYLKKQSLVFDQIITGILAFTILNALNQENVFNLDLNIQFIPLWWICLMLIVNNLPTYSINDQLYFYLTQILVVPIVIYILLIFLKIQGYINPSFYIIWIPLWIIEGILFIISFGASCLIQL